MSPTTIIAGMTKGDLAVDPALGSSLLYQIMIMGEASNYLTDDLRARYPEVDWLDMTGMRNRVVHNYFGTEDAPILRLQMAKLLAAEFPDPPEPNAPTPAAT